MMRIMLYLFFAVSLITPLKLIAADDRSVINREYFGLHIHRFDQGTAWPQVPFGSWRLWDAYVTWADLEPAPNQWKFERLDRLVGMASITKVDVLLPLANTPTWASARPDELSAYKRGNASEPLNMDNWRKYVTKVGGRYKGKVYNYEIWNEPNIKNHYSGSIEKLVELTCEASKILKTIDSRNKIISPSVSAGAKGHVAYLKSFLAKGGKNCIDVVGYHFYVPNSGPEAMLPIIHEAKEAMKSNAVGELPLWNTETGWWIANGDGTPDHPMVSKGGWRKLALERESGDYVVRSLLLAKAAGVERFYWYAWDNYGLGMIDKSGKLKPMTDAWRNTVERLVGATNLSCSQSDKAWNCNFIRIDGSIDQITWVAQ